MGMVWVAYRRDESTARQLSTDPDAIDELLDSHDASSVDLDKAWHGVHWLLTGRTEPAADDVGSQVVFGGEEIGDDLGFGPARVLEPDAVVEVARFLAAADVGALRARLDPTAMDEAGVYPTIWTDPGSVDDYLMPAVARLRDFYAAAAAERQWVIQALC